MWLCVSATWNCQVYLDWLRKSSIWRVPNVRMGVLLAAMRERLAGLLRSASVGGTMLNSAPVSTKKTVLVTPSRMWSNGFGEPADKLFSSLTFGRVESFPMAVSRTGTVGCSCGPCLRSEHDSNRK